MDMSSAMAGALRCLKSLAGDAESRVIVSELSFLVLRQLLEPRRMAEVQQAKARAPSGSDPGTSNRIRVVKDCERVLVLCFHEMTSKLSAIA